MKETGHPAHTGYTIWTHTNNIGYGYKRFGKEMTPCDEQCVFDEEMELYKTYGGD